MKIEEDDEDADPIGSAHHVKHLHGCGMASHGPAFTQYNSC
jgi:hypothetical protein